MMGFRLLLSIYILGGITFVPLLLAAVLLPAWYLQPRVPKTETGSESEHVIGKDKSDVKADDGNEDKSRRHSGDAAASGSFAVLRKYDLQAALTALGARGSNGDKGNGDGTSNESVSVYQSMYRSVFAGNKPATDTLLQHDDTQDSQAARKKPITAPVLYTVLRHGHLMVYDSPSQVEVRHVISLAHHHVSLQAGTHDENDLDEKKIPESDLFIKRTAIVLTPVELPTGALQQANAPPPAKPFYLFSTTNNDKEAFYHALLAARSYPPTPRPLEPDALIKLQSALHSSSITSETRALNAVIGRVFLAIHRSDALNDFIRFKIEKKLARIQKPAYIPSLRIQSLNMGDAGPLLSNLKLRDLNISGDMTVSADMKYTGGLSLTFLAVARLDLGQRFKARTVDLVLKTSINRISGPMLLHIKPPPSNRMWFCFEHVPEMEIRVEPVVSERKITYGFVLRAIEERVRTAIAEGLVRPNWDDVPLPFTDTRGSHARGGLWKHEGEPDNVPSRQSTNNAAQRAAKSASVPDFSLEMDAAASTGVSSQSEENLSRLRHAATMPVDEGNMKRRTAGSLNTEDETSSSQEKSPLRPKSLRSLSISSQAPSVAVNGQNVEPVRADDAELRPNSSTSKRLWYGRGGQNQAPPSKDAVEELRELRDRAGNAASNAATKTVSAIRDTSILPRRSTEMTDAADTDETSSTAETKSLWSQRPSDNSAPDSPTTARSLSTHSAESTATSSSASTSQTQAQTKRANVLAATVAATTAARNWGWNAIQKNKNSLTRPGARTDQNALTPDQPMGRGQPLPPPGQPLPGPPKSLWGGVRRKPAPALPARRPGTASSESEGQAKELRERRSQSSFTDANPPPINEEEFEPWQENSGTSPRNSSQQSLPLSHTASKPASKPENHSPASASPRLHSLSTADNITRPRSSLTPSPSPTLRKKASAERSNIPVLRSSTGAMPPPLPRRPTSGFSSPARSPTVRIPVKERPDPNLVMQEERTPDDTAEVEPSPGLKVPDDEIEAVARENATDEQASGETVDDRKGRLNAEEGRDVEVQEEFGEEESEADRGERLRDVMSGKLQETSVEKKFRRGEDVDEGDFERADADENDQREEGQQDQNEHRS